MLPLIYVDENPINFNKESPCDSDTIVELLKGFGFEANKENENESTLKTHFPGTFTFDKVERLERLVVKLSGNL